MDIVLELWDTFLGDRLYSTVLPSSLASNAAATSPPYALWGASKPFVYEPATMWIYLEPSQYAYMSAWPRNNIYRQFLSFFLIVWYVAFGSPVPWGFLL